MNDVFVEEEIRLVGKLIFDKFDMTRYVDFMSLWVKTAITLGGRMIAQKNTRTGSGL